MTQKGKKYADFLHKSAFEKLQVEVSKTKDLSTKPLINSYFALIGKKILQCGYYMKNGAFILLTMTTSSKIKTRKIPKIKYCSIS